MVAPWTQHLGGRLRFLQATVEKSWTRPCSCRLHAFIVEWHRVVTSRMSMIRRESVWALLLCRAVLQPRWLVLYPVERQGASGAGCASPGGRSGTA